MEDPILYEQTRSCEVNSGNALSVSFSRGESAQSADDFVVPSGEVWKPTRIYAQGSRNLVGAQVQVNIFPDTTEPECVDGEPCPISGPAPVAACSYRGQAQSVGLTIGFQPFEVNLPEDSCVLSAGRYWLSVVEVNLLCGIIAPCQPWFWDETSMDNASREWVIGDNNRSLDVTCTNFGPGSKCQSQPVERNLCFALNGFTEEDFAPSPDLKMTVETLQVDEKNAFEMDPLFIEPNGQPLTFSSADSPQFITLDTDGTVTATPVAPDAGSDPVFSVRATDPVGQSAELLFASRVVDPGDVGFGENRPGNVLVRCAGGESSNGDFASAVAFSEPGDCGDAPASACQTMPVGSTIINARVTVNLSHPEVSDLTIKLSSPQGTVVQLMDRPKFFELNSPQGNCPRSDILALFSDLGAWAVEQQCANPTALLGELEPDEPLAALRNEMASDEAKWTLAVANAGNQTANLNQWCLELEYDAGGRQIYPQSGLPGSARFIDFRDVDSITLTDTLTGPGDVHWYFFEQNNPGVRRITTTLKPDLGQSLRSYRYSNAKFSGFNPQLAVGNCAEEGTLVYPQYVPSFGRDLIRVNGCPDNPAGTYTLTVEKDLSFGFFGFLIQSVGVFNGEIRDGSTGESISRAYLTSDGSAAFSNEDGSFSAALDPGQKTVTVFHPDYFPASFEALSVADETTEIGPVDLFPASYGAVINVDLFSDGFE
ncbi:MAG: proprotein convertase P-domain-containing protein [Lysobacterales bacterium]